MGLFSYPQLRRHLPAARVFFFIEMVTLLFIILILVGIVIALAGPAQNRAARARATAEVQALRNALERYKADNAVYPSDATLTGGLDPRSSSQWDVSSQYQASSQYLYRQISGDDPTRTTPMYPPSPGTSAAKKYFDFKPSMLGGYSSSAASFSVASINDPWGNSYGYSTAYQADLDAGTNPPGKGYSPGYDLWSTAGKTGSKKITSEAQQAQWVKSW